MMKGWCGLTEEGIQQTAGTRTDPTVEIFRYCTLGCGCLYFDWELLDRLATSARLR